jgi:putative ABC transport system ATP-binding protein
MALADLLDATGRERRGPPAPAVACRGVVKDFASGDATLRVLHAIDFEVPAGALTMLVGPSGCGKTTLISIIAGILSPTGGSVAIHGEDLGRMRPRERVAFRRRHIGFIFQQYNLLPALTAAENAAVPLVAAGWARGAAERKAAALLDRLGLGAHAGKMPTQLSGGQQQRVAIARALIHAPRLVVCDEPTAALDAENGRTVMELMRAVAIEPGRAVIVVTHDNRIFRFADRIAEMEDGRITRVAAPAAHGAVH